MPGLIRGMARTAVVAGTATAVSNRVSRRQGERWAAEDQAQYQQQAQDTASDSDYQIEQLRKLGELRDQGILTEEEFAVKKHQILNS
jgi:hypothetical protein